eukprot:3144165-Rhodomonas_salina.2
MSRSRVSRLMCFHAMEREQLRWSSYGAAMLRSVSAAPDAMRLLQGGHPAPSLSSPDQVHLVKSTSRGFRFAAQ